MLPEDTSGSVLNLLDPVDPATMKAAAVDSTVDCIASKETVACCCQRKENSLEGFLAALILLAAEGNKVGLELDTCRPAFTVRMWSACKRQHNRLLQFSHQRQGRMWLLLHV